MHPTPQTIDERLLRAFRRAAADMPWYRALLDEQGVCPDQVTDARSFSARCPLLGKHNTFERFPLAALCATSPIAGLASVLTSSGHGGRFSFGLSTRQQDADSADLIDDALDAAFAVRSRPTLAINCLPMGVGFSSRVMTMAATSVREDMAIALVDAFGPSYEQVLLVADPLFLKRLLDHAAARGLDWRRHRVHVVLGEETFGERFRDYVADALGLDVDRPDRGYIMSSFGVGELGLHLCHETPATIALRRVLQAHPALAADLLGDRKTGSETPAILTFNPARTFVEVVDDHSGGYGQLAISMLDETLPVPLLRYATGDLARMLDVGQVDAALRQRGIRLPGVLPSSLVALAGRERDLLPGGFGVGLYKDALYADAAMAANVTGAFRMVFAGTRATMHVQMTRTAEADEAFGPRLLQALPDEARPAEVRAWAYDRFPFGMSVDYERKFQYYQARSAENLEY